MRKFESVMTALIATVVFGVVVRGFHNQRVLAETPFEVGHVATVDAALDVDEVYQIAFNESGRPALVSRTNGCRVNEGQRMEVVATPASDKIAVRVELLGNPSEGQCDDGLIAIVPRSILRRPSLQI